MKTWATSTPLFVRLQQAQSPDNNLATLYCAQCTGKKSADLNVGPIHLERADQSPTLHKLVTGLQHA